MIHRGELRKVIQSHPILAILRGIPDDILEDYVQTIYDGGVSFLEVAMNTPAASEQIRRLKNHWGEQLLVGAGTVISVEKAKEAIKAGADFLLAPSTNPEVLDYCSRNDIAMIPGAFTASEVTVCMSYGYYDIKLFPAIDLPKRIVKDLKGPLTGTEYVAIGGVGMDNMEQFLEAGYLGVGLASSMMPREILAGKDWEQGKAYVRKLCEKAAYKGFA